MRLGAVVLGFIHRLGHGGCGWTAVWAKPLSRRHGRAHVCMRLRMGMWPWHGMATRCGSVRLGIQGEASDHSDADIGREGVALSVGCFQGQDVAPGLFGFVAQAPNQNFQSPEIVMLGLMPQVDGQIFVKVRVGWQSRRA